MLLSKMLKELESKGRSKNTFIALNKTIVTAEKRIGKPLEDLTLDEILEYIESVKKKGKIKTNMIGKPLSDSTIRMIQVHFIQFYRWCYDETDDAKYLSLAKKLKKKSIGKQRNSLNPQDLLTPEDVKKLINVATLERDRCLVASLFESGMRIGEIMNLKKSMIEMNDAKQEVTFHIPNIEGSKTGSRIVPCVDIHGYVQDWLKCNESDTFFDISQPAIRVILSKLFNKAGIKKPCNPHIFRHSAITNSVNIGLQSQVISMRYWGISSSHMLATYVHLSEQQQATAYKKAKGQDIDELSQIPLAERCVNCGKLIASGDLCKPCSDNKKLFEENKALKITMQDAKNEMAEVKKVLEKYKNFASILANAEVRATSNEGKGVLEFIEKDSRVERLEPDLVSLPHPGEKVVKMKSNPA